MTKPDRDDRVHSAWRFNPVLLVLVGLIVLLLLIWFFSTRRNGNPDRLTENQLAQTTGAESPEKRCASKETYELIKQELFRRAAQLRGSDQAAYDKLSAYAVVRMENPVLEREDKDTGAVNCSGSLSLDLPPSVAVVGGRHSLMSDIDYTVTPAADGTGNVVLLRNADSIITPLATLARVSEPVQQPVEPTMNTVGQAAGSEGEFSTQPTPNGPGVVTPPGSTPSPATPSPSFDCANATTRGEQAVCSDAGLSALDRNMAGKYRQAFGQATEQQAALLRRTRDRFLSYRDRCPTRACIADAYVGRMREIRDIMQGP